MKKTLIKILIFSFLINFFGSISVYAFDEETYIEKCTKELQELISTNKKNIELGRYNEVNYLKDFFKESYGTDLLGDYRDAIQQNCSQYEGKVIVVVQNVIGVSELEMKENLIIIERANKSVFSNLTANGEQLALFILNPLLKSNAINYQFTIYASNDLDAKTYTFVSAADLKFSQDQKKLSVFLNVTSGIDEATSANGLSALYAKNEELNLQTNTLDNNLPNAILTSVIIRFSERQNVTANSQIGLRDAFSKMLNDPICRKFFNKEQLSNDAILDYFINTQGWHWNNDFVIPENEDYKVNFSYRELWLMMTPKFPKARDAFLEYIYGLYAGAENEFIIEEILLEYQNRYSTDLDHIIRIASVAKLLGQERWNDYPILLSDQTSDFSSYYNSLYAYYLAYTKFDKILACNTPGDGEGQMTSIMRTLSENEYIYLPVRHRIHVLEIISKGSMSGKINVDQPIKEEDIVLKILKFTAKKDEKAILDALVVPRSLANTTSPLIDLISGIDGENYSIFILTLTDWLISNYPNQESWQEILERTKRAERNILPLGDFLDGYSTEIGTMGSNTVFRFYITVNPSIPIETYKLINVNAYDYIVVKFTSNYSFAGKSFSKGSIYTLPSFFVYAMMHDMSVHTWVTTGKYTLYAAFLAIGVGEIMLARTGLQMAIALADMAVATSDILVNEILATKLSQTDDGKAFLDKWNKFVLIYGGARVYSELSGLNRELTELSRRINNPEVDELVTRINKKIGSLEADVIVNGAGSVFKVGDNIAGKIVQNVKSGTNGKIAVIGRRMPGHVELVAQELLNQGKQVEIFNDFYQAGKPFDIEGQIYLWEDIVADFNNLKQQYVTIPNNILENSLMFKANQKWANKLLSEGYEVIDIGYPQGTTTQSIFYNMELQTIFP
jgi:hypothetical protein